MRVLGSDFRKVGGISVVDGSAMKIASRGMAATCLCDAKCIPLLAAECLLGLWAIKEFPKVMVSGWSLFCCTLWFRIIINLHKERKYNIFNKQQEV